MTKNKTGNFTGWILMVFGIMVTGVPMVVMAAGSTVERHPQGGSTTTVERQGPCVIDLAAPKRRGDCHLKLNDPPAKLIVKGWYKEKGITVVREVLAQKGLTKKEIDSIADALFAHAKKTKDPVRFWTAKKIKAPSVLDAAPGSTTLWIRKKLVSKEELKAEMNTALAWARAWKKYRGSKYAP